MNIRMKRGMALVLMASLLLAGSAQALFGLGKSKPETVSPENGPTARDLEIRTYRSIPYLGQLEAADPDGGELTFAIVTQPKKGTVTVEGANFTYTPKENAAGGDSFTYSAANSAGAVSLPATVTVTIEKTRSGVTYADTGEATATAAQDLAERGVFTGAKIGDKWYFEPDRTVSRGEFLAMVLETAGAEVTDVTMTGFRDDDAIPTWAKSYAAAGVAEGILRGKPTENGAVFSCEDPISFSEAATVLNRVLDLGDVELEVWFADREAVPSWAAQAVGNMEALNVLSVGSFGSERLETAVTRADAARMLSAAGTLLRGEKDTGRDALDWISWCAAHGAGEICLNSIDTDGVRHGFDLEMLDAVAARVNIPIIASGGAGKKEDFLELFHHKGIDAGLAAGIFHQKLLGIRELKEYLNASGVEMRL